jgi:hypothetical protein
MIGVRTITGIHFLDEFEIELKALIEVFVEGYVERVPVVLMKEHHSHDLGKKEIRRILEADVADLPFADPFLVRFPEHVLQPSPLFIELSLALK